MKDINDYELIDWECKIKDQADALGIQIWQKLSTPEENNSIYDIRLTRNGIYFAEYKSIHGSMIHQLLQFCKICLQYGVKYER